MEDAMTDSLERSLQNCSLTNNHKQKEEQEQEEEEHDDVLIVDNHHVSNSNSDTTLDLNSHLSLPYHWEQCLDLKTGEIYYINWRNGMKAKEDPRSSSSNNNRNDGYQESEEEEESWDDSEESSSSESWCPSSSSNNKEFHQNQNQNQNNNNVLVVAGCKTCLMYFMVPKQVQHCPKCSAQLLHFDPSSQTNLPTSPSP